MYGLNEWLAKKRLQNYYYKKERAQLASNSGGLYTRVCDSKLLLHDGYNHGLCLLWAFVASIIQHCCHYKWAIQRDIDWHQIVIIVLVSWLLVILYYPNSSLVKIGRPHPDPVVESRWVNQSPYTDQLLILRLFVCFVCCLCSSLSSVEPPDVYFNLQLPSEGIDSGKLSSLQLESVIYACQQHKNLLMDGTRAGFLVGM